MDQETKHRLLFDPHNKIKVFGRLVICYGYEDGLASFGGGIKIMWLKKSYEDALKARATKMFPGILEEDYMN